MIALLCFYSAFFWTDYPEDVNSNLEHNPVLNINILFPQKGLKNVFDEAILAALEPPEPKKRRRCVLL